MNSLTDIKNMQEIREWVDNATAGKSYAREVEDHQNEINERKAQALILEGKSVSDLLNGYEIDVSAELARIMRELDRACRGDSISTTAVLTACSHIQDKLIIAARHSVR